MILFCIVEAVNEEPDEGGEVRVFLRSALPSFERGLRLFQRRERLELADRRKKLLQLQGEGVLVAD